jgi:hypothetical protein
VLLGDDDNEGVLNSILPDTLIKPFKLLTDLKEVVLLNYFPSAQNAYSNIAKTIDLSPVYSVNDEDNIHFPYMSSKNINKRMMEYQGDNPNKVVLNLSPCCNKHEHTSHPAKKKATSQYQ